MNHRAITPPLTLFECVSLLAATWIMLLAALSVTTGLDLAKLYVDDDPELTAHRPMPDLCTTFPASAAGFASGFALAAQADSRTLDRNTARCTFAATATGRTRFLHIQAHRPTPRRHIDEETAARREYRDAFKNPSLGGFAALPRLGDEAKAAVATDRSMPKAMVVIRDGLLIVEVEYDASGASNPGLATVKATAQQAATELLKILPPHGR